MYVCLIILKRHAWQLEIFWHGASPTVVRFGTSPTSLLCTSRQIILSVFWPDTSPTAVRFDTSPTSLFCTSGRNLECFWFVSYLWSNSFFWYFSSFLFLEHTTVAYLFVLTSVFYLCFRSTRPSHIFVLTASVNFDNHTNNCLLINTI